MATIDTTDCGEVSANRRMRSSPAGMLTVPAASVALISIGAAFAWPFVVAFIPQLRKGDSESVKPWIRHPDTAYVIVRDGRSLSYQIYGDTDGRHLCFWFHGTPSCRLEAAGLDAAVLEDLSIKVVAVDRPGYGQSDPHPDRSYASLADDVAQIADQFGVQHFYVAGMSGGGPYALATLSYLPQRVKAAIVNCAAGSWGALSKAERGELSLSPLQNVALQVLAGASKWRSFQKAFKWVATTPAISHQVYELLKPRYDNVLDTMTENDSRCLRRPPHFFEEHVIPETLRQQSAEPWIEDHILFFNPWAFNLGDIPQPQVSRIIITHGSNDSIVPDTFSKALKRIMPSSHLDIVEGGGHIDYWWCDAEVQRLTFAAMLRH